MAKVALITGVTGQDGSYLAETLLNKGYEVHGMVRRTSSFATGRIAEFTRRHELVMRRFTIGLSDIRSGAPALSMVEKRA